MQAGMLQWSFVRAMVPPVVLVQLLRREEVTGAREAARKEGAEVSEGLVVPVRAEG